MTSLTMLQCSDTWRPPIFSITPMQGFLKFQPVSSNQNIWDHLWRLSSVFGQQKFADCSIFEKLVHHGHTSPNLCRETEKGIKTESYHSWFAGFIGHFPPLVESSCSKYHIRALCTFLDFLAGILWGLQKAAQGSGSQARKIAFLPILWLWVQTMHCICGSTVEPRSTDTPLIWTPCYYGQFGIPRPKAHTFL